MKGSESKVVTGAILRMITIGLIVIGIQAAPSSVQAAGKLILDPMSFDCGIVDEGTPASMQVRIENVGDSPVLIQNVQTN